MNKKFFDLPTAKQRAMINAAMYIFSKNSYKKSPTSEIATAAGVSKGLLFYYFKNKKELYLFIVDICVKLTVKTLKEYGCYEETDLFEAMHKGLQAKLNIMRHYPYITEFIQKAFYEKDPELQPDLHNRFDAHMNQQYRKFNILFDPKHFIEGLDLSMMYQQMQWTVQGYIWEKSHSHKLTTQSIEEIGQEFKKLIDFWKSIYARKG